jgi:hypothetical protein
VRRFVSLSVNLSALFIILNTVSAVHAASHHDAANWRQHDIAVYVVSTMNLLHAHSGQALTATLAQRLGVTHYDVYADQQVANLYFIEPRKNDESSVGALAYQMGWVAPMSVSTSFDKLHVRRAPKSDYSAYRSDLKQLIDSFTSTVPS